MNLFDQARRHATVIADSACLKHLTRFAPRLAAPVPVVKGIARRRVGSAPMDKGTT